MRVLLVQSLVELYYEFGYLPRIWFARDLCCHELPLANRMCVSALAGLLQPKLPDITFLVDRFAFFINFRSLKFDGLVANSATPCGRLFGYRGCSFFFHFRG